LFQVYSLLFTVCSLLSADSPQEFFELSDPTPNSRLLSLQRIPFGPDLSIDFFALGAWILEFSSHYPLSSYYKPTFMIQFFQVLFLIAAVILIVLNVLDFNKWQESRKEGSTKPHPLNWFNFILTSTVAVGCVLNIIVAWIRKG